MSVYNIPFCFLPNSKIQTINTNNLNVLRSEFQLQQIHKVSQRPNFAYFVTLVDDNTTKIITTEFEGPYTIMFYDKDGQCWAGRVGVKRMLKDWYKVGEPSTPVSLNSVVYQSRTVNQQ